MLPILIQRYDKKIIPFLSSSKTRDYLKFYRLSNATFYDHINTIYINLLNLSWIKNVYFEEYGAFDQNIMVEILTPHFFTIIS